MQKESNLFSSAAFALKIAGYTFHSRAIHEEVCAELGEVTGEDTLTLDVAELREFRRGHTQSIPARMRRESASARLGPIA